MCVCECWCACAVGVVGSGGLERNRRGPRSPPTPVLVDGLGDEGCVTEDARVVCECECECASV